MITGGKAKRQKGKEIREQTDHYCNYFYKLKGNKYDGKNVQENYWNCINNNVSAQAIQATCLKQVLILFFVSPTSSIHPRFLDLVRARLSASDHVDTRAHMWRSEDNVVKWAFSFYFYIDSRVKFGSSGLYSKWFVHPSSNPKPSLWPTPLFSSLSLDPELAHQLATLAR